MSSPSGTVTLLFTDIEGSTALWEAHRAEMEQSLARHDELLRLAIEGSGGYVFKTVGDAFCATFSNAEEAIRCAVQAQRALATETWPDPLSLRVRMALHTGVCQERDGDYFGPTVNRTARLEAIGHGGQTLISAATAGLVQGTLPDGCGLVDLGEHHLKDLGVPEHVFQLTAEGLETNFPPLRSLDNPTLRHNLPEQLAAFVGRSDELVHVRNLVSNARLVTLCGAGGSGKTRLALQTAAELLDGSGDGVWLVELAPLFDEDLVAHAIAETLGIPERPGRAMAETLVNALQTQNILIILDNCEHLVGSCAKVAETLVRRCPRVHIMATSREPLGITGETIYRVPAMSLPSDDELSVSASDAVALFVDRAQAQDVDLRIDADTAGLLASICRRLDGMPLAIELAAARLRSLSFAAIHDRLDQRFRLLTGGSRTALERQQTLRATVDWSYSLLNAVEAELLCRLSVFAESFSLEAAEAVCGFGDVEVFDVADVLGSLVDKSLVQTESSRSTVRYHLLETIRQFAAERLVERDGEAGAVADAHCSFFLSLAEEAHPHLEGLKQIEWADRLDLDHANFLRAFEYAKGTENAVEYLLRFGWALFAYWLMRDRRREGLEVLRTALDDGDAEADPQVLGRGLVAAVYVGRGLDLPGAISWSDRALELAAHVDDERLMIEALNTRASTSYFAGEIEQGFQAGREALGRARAFGDDALLGRTLLVHLLCSDSLQPDKTDALYAEAIVSTERSGDLLSRCILLNNAGVYELRKGNLASARHFIEGSIALDEKLGGSFRDALINLGWILRKELDLDRARDRFEAAVRLGRLQGDTFSIAYSALGLACVTADARAWRQAATLFGIADSLMEFIGAPWQDPELAYRSTSINCIVEQIGADSYEEEHRKGATLSLEAAIDYCRTSH